MHEYDISSYNWIFLKVISTFHNVICRILTTPLVLVKYILRNAAKTCHYNLLNDAIFFSSLLYPYYLILICHCLNCLCSYRYFCLFFCSSSVHFNFESHFHNTVNVYNAINIELENVRLFLLVSSNSSWDLKNIY